ncbi:MAG: response regulator transcription factor [Rhodospirillales bacterium]|nr:response regulator transcription factor [Rhodospirillales bacterium]
MTREGTDRRRREGGAKPGPIDVALADKNPLVLTGLKRILEEDERFNLVVTASDGERFLEALDRVLFDVAVIGWVMPYCDGHCVLEKLRTRPNAPRIVVYTGSADPQVSREVMALGGAGFCSKSDPPEVLLETVASVGAGRMVFPYVDVGALDEDPLHSLTTRERELLASLAGGASNADLAKAFGVSINTVKFHLRNLYDKLSVRNRAQAVARHAEARHRRS